MLDDILRDKFISGLLNGPILDRLCEEEHTRTINEVLDIALKKEASMKQIAMVEDVNKFKVNKGRFSHSKEPRSQGDYQRQFKNRTHNKKPSNCFVCGKNNHNFNNCKYKTYRCKMCNAVGHLAIVCKKNAGGQF